MNSKFDVVVWIVAIAAVLVTLLNPGGLIIGAIIALLLLGSRYGLPWVGDYVKQRNSGIGQAKLRQSTRDRLRRDSNRGDDK